MLGVIVTFQYDGDLDAERVRRIADESHTPLVRRDAGLRSKLFTLDEAAVAQRTSMSGSPRRPRPPSSPTRSPSA